MAVIHITRFTVISLISVSLALRFPPPRRSVDERTRAGYQANMTDYTPHQKKIIERYYDRRDEIMLARLGEIVSELYLAETNAQVNRLWKRAEKAMSALQVPQSIVRHIVTRRDPEVLAHNLRGWLQRTDRAPKSGGE